MIDGECRCGRVGMAISVPPLLTMACHCRGCQRMSASAFSLSAAIAPDGFAVTRGTPVIGGLHGPLEHYFCGWCMTWLFTRPPGFPFVNVRPTMFDAPALARPFIETFTAARLPGVTTGAVHAFAAFPPAATYEDLIVQYRQFSADTIA